MITLLCFAVVGAAPPASLRDWRNTKKLAAVRMLARGSGFGARPLGVPGPLMPPPSGFALAAAFDTVKADDHAAHGGR